MRERGSVTNLRPVLDVKIEKGTRQGMAIISVAILDMNRDFIERREIASYRHNDKHLCIRSDFFPDVYIEGHSVDLYLWGDGRHSDSYVTRRNISLLQLSWLIPLLREFVADASGTMTLHGYVNEGIFSNLTLIKY